MTLLSHVALVASLLAIGLGFLTILAERGYAFDQRRGRRSRRKASRSGGRRRTDMAGA